VLLDRRVAAPRRLERDEALGELALRYFAGHGPATLADLTGWAKLTAGDARVALAVVRPRLAELVYGEQRYLMAADAEDVLRRAEGGVAGSVLALPGFDEYLLGYKGRDDVLPREHAGRVVPRGNGMFLPTVVVDGQIVGTWRRTARKRSTLVELEPFTRMTARAKAGFAVAAAAWGSFRGVDVELASGVHDAGARLPLLAGQAGRG
jgi:hypothetical protein